MTAAQPPNHLDYQAKPCLLTRVRSHACRIGLLVGGIVVVAVIVLKAQPKLESWYVQRQCSLYAPNPSEVVYQELPPDYDAPPDPKFSEIKTDSALMRIRIAPPCVRVLQQWCDVAPPASDWREAMLFLGGLETPKGDKRIVCLMRRTRDNSATTLGDNVTCLVVVPRALGGQVTKTFSYTRPKNASRWVVGSYARRFEFLAGQRDLADSTHFTVPYRADDERGTIDGWLRDDDSVVLSVRDGPGQVKASIRER